MRSERKKTYQKLTSTTEALVCAISVPLAAFSFVGVSQPVYARSVAAANIAQGFSDVMNPYVANASFSGVVLLAEHDNVVAEKAYGYANMQTKAPITLDTRLAIGALTQSFTAVAIMQLHERGLLNLQDNLLKFFPDYPKSGQNITVQELLTHTSGAPADASQSSAQPGTMFRYSILNYILLGGIIQKVSGQSYSSYIQQHVFNVLGMKNSGFIKKLSDVPNSALGYIPNNNVLNPVDIQMHNEISSDGIYSTVGDMYKWEQALQSSSLVNAADLREIFTPDPITFNASKTVGYGYGWDVTGDGNVVFNESRYGGFHSFLAHNQKYDYSMIFLTNEDSTPIDAIAPKFDLLLQEDLGVFKAATSATPVRIVRLHATLSSTVTHVRGSHPILKVLAYMSNGKTQNVTSRATVSSLHGFIRIRSGAVVGVKQGSDTLLVTYGGQTTKLNIIVR